MKYETRTIYTFEWREPGTRRWHQSLLGDVNKEGAIETAESVCGATAFRVLKKTTTTQVSLTVVYKSH